MTFDDFFKRLTGFEPLPYQRSLAEGAWPELIDVPTGLGKTAAVLAAWLWKLLRDEADAARRLIYCLPMRSLVDQTASKAVEWCDAARSVFNDAGRPVPSVHMLMGGDVGEQWQRHPELPAVIVGTQDMLISRALNRGYAMPRTRWPMHFGMLGNDCTWVLDETQLMGVGVTTSAQLQGLRRSLGTCRPVHTIWMSATVASGELDTVDHPQPDAGWSRHTLSAADQADQTVTQRLHATKRIEPLDCPALSKVAEPQVIERITQAALHAHGARGGLTLVVVNRVARAQAIYTAIRKADPDADAALVHSRFRPPDRKANEDSLLASHDRIVVATQAVEAGVDVSSRTMITDLAPWPSLVQRFGRCNRYGDEHDARIWWVDIATDDPKDPSPLPYSASELERARALLRGLQDVSPKLLSEVSYEPDKVVRPVLRRRDLLDLFDTTPDLSGLDIDVSRFVRDGEDTDVQVAWRDVTAESRRNEQPVATELCRVGVAAFNAFLSDLGKRRRKLADKKDQAADLQRAWQWNQLDERWTPVDRVRPGSTVVLHPAVSGYDPLLGWTGKPGAPVAPLLPAVPVPAEAMDADPETPIGRWVPLAEHHSDAQQQAERLCDELELVGAHRSALKLAARWHDVGKAHPVFQARLTRPVEDEPALSPPTDGELWAKSSHKRRLSPPDRPYFRHELASALAWLAAGEQPDGLQDLVAYLIAAHHGKVRMSIRSVPGERPHADGDLPFARGVWHGDQLQELCWGDGARLEALTLDLTPVRLGEGSWLERTLALRDSAELGPFRLAWLETLVRVADWRASELEEKADCKDKEQTNE